MSFRTSNIQSFFVWRCAPMHAQMCDVLRLSLWRSKKHFDEERLERDMGLVFLSRKFSSLGSSHKLESNSERLPLLLHKRQCQRISRIWSRRSNSHASCFNVNVSSPQLPPKRTTCMCVAPSPVRYYQRPSRSCTRNSCSQYLRLLPACMPYAMPPSM